MNCHTHIYLSINSDLAKNYDKILITWHKLNKERILDSEIFPGNFVLIMEWIYLLQGCNITQKSMYMCTTNSSCKYEVYYHTKYLPKILKLSSIYKCINVLFMQREFVLEYM